MKSPFTPNAFFAPEGAPRAPERRRSPKEIILSQYPELNNLKDLPEEQIKARAEAINKLDQYIKDVSRFSRGNAEEGWTSYLKHAFTLDSTFQSIQEQMKTIRNLLTKPFDEVNNSEGWDKIIATHLNYIQGDGSANLETISTRMSQRVFLERIVGRNLAGKILVSHQNPETLPTLDKSQIQQKSRLHQLMQVIELQKSGDLGDKVMGNNGKKVTLAAAIRHTSTLLEHNRVQEAVNYFARAIDGKYRGIHVHSVVASNEASADALRALGDTTSAGKVYAETFANNKDLSPESGKTQELYNTLAAELQKAENPANSPYRHRAEVLYHKTINALDPNHPNRLIMEEYREETITSLEGGIILEQTISNFIRSRGSEWLPLELQRFDDMKGLYGFFNFTDENAKLTREIALILASFVITAGAWPLVGALAASTRLAWAARFVNAANHFRNGKYLHAAGSALKSSSAFALHRGATAANTVIQAGSRSRVATLAWHGFTFTASNQILRAMPYIRMDGEETFNIPDFMTDLAKNTAMFAAFAGTEKLLTPIARARFMAGIPEQTTLAKFWEIATFTAGDIAVMQAMHAAENGKLEWDWIGVAQALVFRVGMKAFQNQFKSLWDRATPEQKAALQAVDDARPQSHKETTPQGENPASKNTSAQQPKTSAQIGRERLEQILPIDRAATRNSPNVQKNPNGNETFTFPEGTHNQVIHINGQQWTFKQKSQSWARNNGNGDIILIKPGETLVFWSHTPPWTPKQTLTKSQEFTQAIDGSTPRTYRIELLNNEKHRVLVQNADGSFVEATVGNGIPRSHSIRKHYDARIAHELANLKNSPIKSSNRTPEIHTFTEENLFNGWNQLNRSATGTVLELAITTTEWPGFAKYQRQSNGQWRHVESNVSAYGMVDDILKLRGTPPTSQNPHHTFRLESNGLPITEMKFTTPWVQAWTSLIPFRAWQNPLIRIPEKHLPALRTAESQLQTSNLPVPVLENTNAAQSYVRTHWHILSSDLAAVSALITLARLKGRTPDAPIPFIPPLETLTPETLAELCIRCLEGEKSTLDYNRHSAANNAIILTEDRRNNISKRWIQSTEWQEAMKLWDELVASGIPFQEEDELKDKIRRIRENPTVEDVQELQRCIGMIAEDAAIGQDGILGKNTTAALQAFIEQCLQEQKEHSNKEDSSHTPWEWSENPTPASEPTEQADQHDSNISHTETVDRTYLDNIPDADITMHTD